MEIVIEKVDYIYHPGTPFESQALRQVSMKIPAGSFAMILGPTGSGKSTFIQLIAGLLTPTSGEIRIGDHRIDKKSKGVSSLKGKVGLIFQYPENQLFAETIGKDIAFGPTNLGWDESTVKEKVKKAMALVGIPYQWIDRSPFTLSGGQMRKVAIAGVLAMEPEILILDEPTAGLDPKSQRELLHLITQIHQQQKNTVIMVTHQVDHAAEFAERIYLMNQGTCVADGTPEQIFSNNELLLRLGLDLPETVKLVQQINQKLNPPLPSHLLTLEELVDALDHRRKGGECI